MWRTVKTTASWIGSTPKAWPTFPSSRLVALRRYSRRTLDDAASALRTTPMVVALAWLLQRSPNMLLIPGTSSVAHLRENISAASIQLPQDILHKLNEMGHASVI